MRNVAAEELALGSLKGQHSDSSSLAVRNPTESSDKPTVRECRTAREPTAVDAGRCVAVADQRNQHSRATLSINDPY